MAQQPKKRKRRIKRRVRITQKARIQKKDSVQNDTIRRDTLMKAPAKVYPENGAHFKIKIRRK